MHNPTPGWPGRTPAGRRARQLSAAAALAAVALLGACSSQGTASGPASSAAASPDPGSSAAVEPNPTTPSVPGLQVTTAPWQLPQPMSGLVAVAVGDHIV
ncbi:MAG: hypothetical protein ACXWA3_09640, partial [Acidimicrobiales bacterium]